MFLSLFAMKTYNLYVWISYGLLAIVLAGGTFHQIINRKKVKRVLRQWFK